MNTLPLYEVPRSSGVMVGVFAVAATSNPGANRLDYEDLPNPPAQDLVSSDGSTKPRFR